MKVTASWFAFFTFVAVFPAAADGEPPGTSTCRFAMHTDGRPIVLPVTCQGNSYSFVVDTGSSDCVFDLKYKSILGEPTSVEQFRVEGKFIECEVFETPSATVGVTSMTLPKRTVCADLSSMSATMGKDIDGILGMTFLHDVVLELGFDDAEVRLGTRLPPGDRGARIALTDHRGGLCAVLAVLGAANPLEFVIDTGLAGPVMIDVPAGEKVINDDEWKITGAFSGLSLAGPKQLAALRTSNNFQIGPFEHRELVFCLHKDECLIGLQYLRRYNVTFDFPRGAVYLKPSRYFSDYDHGDLFGAILEQGDQDASVRIATFIQGSAADRMGVQSGDVVHAIDGRIMRGNGLLDVHFAIATHRERELVLLVERRGKLVELRAPAMHQVFGAVRNEE